MSVADIRQNYEKFELLEASLAATPFEQFTLWFDDALKAEVPEPNAMTLATTTPDGRPSARIVLLKGFDRDGFVFYTNYSSRKGQELAGNPYAGLLFFWPALERQVRIEGRIEKTSAQESDEYYRSRPLGSRIGAWVSPQSRPITRAELEARAIELTGKLGDDPARPEHWGGYRLRPDYVEFWQGRPSRLHDRLVFKLEDEAWVKSRLAP
ncbi:pyridoxamine 5'-phosphate oxidase [Parapusillimonas granuli]|uniref:Pyridoxine/pyridoxamine 5'-phosphate oxidase n=1 Tax=Parapusillimonas granuli TaxID=380911 RepID=A0A853FZD8_9BURK|nr:pyridoxamine 5'-phosphate oxidase [Parapusillimonas granuli]MBB5215111.1 pyridoxamine 5'-phosphate oxidase [Parapusillimonas granuli]MEB2401418.1 pyridoxamine 5'-phosphate oxidase [Alcaligenaceae bacterium]NYT49429.1 pyridoxamine 5'-phosphate oxidase [Parapusillimonas granuli]